MAKKEDYEKQAPDSPASAPRKKVWLRRIIYTAVGMILGGIAGYLWCGISGSCPITSNPAIAAVAGGIFGLLWTLDR